MVVDIHLCRCFNNLNHCLTVHPWILVPSLSKLSNTTCVGINVLLKDLFMWHCMGEHTTLPHGGTSHHSPAWGNLPPPPPFLLTIDVLVLSAIGHNIGLENVKMSSSLNLCGSWYANYSLLQMYNFNCLRLDLCMSVDIYGSISTRRSIHSHSRPTSHTRHTHLLFVLDVGN